MATIQHQVLVHAPVTQVYQALSTPDGIGAWWDKQTATQTDRGLIFSHNPGPEHGEVQLLVVESIPNQRVEWECISQHPASSPASAWTGTHFHFDLEGRGAATAVVFRQTGYDESSPFFKFNQTAWGEVIENLKRVVESRG
jgi:uncharacterized protein YndB with AHSA1/START domain